MEIEEKPEIIETVLQYEKEIYIFSSILKSQKDKNGKIICNSTSRDYDFLSGLNKTAQ